MLGSGLGRAERGGAGGFVGGWGGVVGAGLRTERSEAERSGAGGILAGCRSCRTMSKAGSEATTRCCV